MGHADPSDAAPRRPTQADVARLAGVSVPLVSAVVSGSPGSRSIGASAETRRRVWDAVRTLGYVPNVAARSLAGGRNRMISVFTYDAVFPAESANFYHEFFVGIEQEADTQGYSLLLANSSRGADGKRAIYANGNNSLQMADGAVILGGHHETSELTRLMTDRFPFVHVGRRDVPEAAISYIAADYIGGSFAATKALVDLGHRRIGFGSTELPTESAQDRRAGFVQAVSRLGLDPDQCPVLPSRTGDLLDRTVERELTAIVMETTNEANALRRKARQRGIAVPERLSMISLGGLDAGPPRQPHMARLAIPRREMGRKAVRTLIRLLDDPTYGPVQETLPCKLTLTHTVAPPPVA